LEIHTCDLLGYVVWLVGKGQVVGIQCTWSEVEFTNMIMAIVS